MQRISSESARTRTLKISAITRHDKPAEAYLIGFESEEDWFDYRLEHA